MKTKSLIIGSIFISLLFSSIILTANFADAQAIISDPGEGGIECQPGETRNAVRYDDDTTKCEYHNNRCCCPDDF